MTFSGDFLKAIEIVATLAGVAYVILAARRDRLCWIPGAIASALSALLAWLNALPLHSLLNVYYVVMSVYGWYNWSRSLRDNELPVSTLPLRWHLVAGVAITALSFVTARVIPSFTESAWPLLDSLTTWFSLFTMWLVARAKLENWIYWIVIDGVLVFVFYAQELRFMALLFVFYLVVAVAGFVAWRRRLVPQEAPA